MHCFLVLRSALHTTRSRSRTAHGFTSLAVRRVPPERIGLCLDDSSRAKRLFANNNSINDSSIELLKREIMQISGDRSSPMQVHASWKALSSEQQQEQLVIATELFDAWIRYHADLLKAYDSEDSNESTLIEIIDCANQAHNVLDRLYPQWSPRRFGKSSNETGTIADPAAVARARQILTVWAFTSEVGHCRLSCKQLRGIPQRAQFLWQQLPKSTDSSNAMLRTWVYSHEHWRGTRSQSIFDEMITTPNAETYRLMIRNWAWSGERRGAFAATGFLRKMLRLLEQGNTDMEPSLEEYRIVLKSWTTAK